MDPASIASSLVNSQAGQTQSNLAIAMTKMNANAQDAIVQMIESAAQSGSQAASLPPGVGGKLDVSA